MCILCETNPVKVREYGIIFGYPECCIEEYIRDTDVLEKTGKDPRNKVQIKIAKEKHGFVPCKKHAKMIRKNLTTAENLVAETRNHEKSSELNKLAHI
jgi:hypothetical protein